MRRRPSTSASTAAVLVAVLRNLDVPGMAVVAVGAACNLAAIVANGGYMPADPAALASVGGPDGGHDQQHRPGRARPAPADGLFAIPDWMPFANVFSIGDVLIGVGIAITIALGMRGARDSASPTVRPGRGS